MTPAGYSAAVLYTIGVIVFLYVGFSKTRYSAWLVIPIALFWLPATIVANIIKLFMDIRAMPSRTRDADARATYDRKNIRAEQSRDFWRYVPAISKPFNPAYQRVWHSMSHRERQTSFLIDVGVIASVGVLCWWFG